MIFRAIQKEKYFKRKTSLIKFMKFRLQKEKPLQTELED